ncbi:MAG: ATP-binding cassette domain-containing protein [Alphaproteobacteria bacterium]|nr:ATP-binding cassette domain-containing protein [Alphaproteobacteria bacterium]
MEEQSIISFANVSANYDGGQDVLSNVSFNISNGGFYFLTGASGAGKTTLLRLIYQLHKPNSGQIKLFGKSCADLSHDNIANLRHKMAIVFQEYSLISHLNVFDNVALPLKVRGIDSAKIKKLVTKTLDWVGLSKFANSFPKELSGGQQQRVSVARAIIIQPAILLADEPTGNLDDDNSTRLMELFIQMNKILKTTIILATHNKKLLETYNFPVITIMDHHVNFASSSLETARKWKGPKPQNQTAFTEQINNNESEKI